MSTHNHPLEGLRSSLANAAMTVEERIVWSGSDALRGAADAVRWSFERVVWALERAVLWPLEERTGDWSRGLRALGALAVVLLAAAAGVLGLLWAKDGGGGGAANQAEVAPPAPVSQLSAPPAASEKPAAPVLHGAAPDFTREADGGAGGSNAAATEAGANPAQAKGIAGAEVPAATPSAAKGALAGPGAIRVAHRFATAFVLYETGQRGDGVRAAFAATATPQLARKLLQRPPRLPANGRVPKARVLNVVSGPRHGDTYTLSISLLRVGLTSELRIDMRRDGKSHGWQVTDVRG